MVKEKGVEEGMEKGVEMGTRCGGGNQSLYMDNLYMSVSLPENLLKSSK